MTALRVEGGVSWGDSSLPLLQQRSDTPNDTVCASNIVSKKPSELQRRSAPEPLRLTDFSSSQQPLGAGRELRGTYHFAQCPADCTCWVLSRTLAAAGLVRTIGIARAKAKIGLIKPVYNIRRLVTLERMAAA